MIKQRHLRAVFMFSVFGLLGSWCVCGAAAKPEGLLAHYTFSEGTGTVLKDHSGNGHNGTIHGAKWVKTATGCALRFKQGDFVDLGSSPDFNLPGDRTIAVWAKLEAPSVPDVSTNWVILDGGDDFPNRGYMLRIDGDSTKVSYRHNVGGRADFCTSRGNIENNTYYYIVVTRQDKTLRVYIDGMLDLQMEAGESAPAKRPFTIGQAAQSFLGLIEDMALYRRALPADQIIQLYRQGAAGRSKDTAWIGTIQLTPYCHYDQGTLAVDAGFMGVLPLRSGQQASVELGEPGQPPVRVEKIKEMPAGGRYEHAFSIKDLPAGKYEVAALVKDASGRVLKRAAVPLVLPYVPVAVAAPAEKTVADLPTPAVPVPYRLEVGTGGGLKLRIGNETYPVESAFSWPKGRFNGLKDTAPAKGTCEPEWKVTVRQEGERTWRVSASGRYYTLERTIKAEPTHVNVRDTLTNKAPEALGVLFRHAIDSRNRGIASARVAGMEMLKPKAGTEVKSNPTLFLRKPGLGLGLIALDDVFIVQAKADFDFDRSALYSTQFALDKGASYTLEWSLYLNASADYYDFINQVRRDEGRNGRVDGGMALYFDRGLGRRSVPTKQYAEVRNIKYINYGCLSHCEDDPQVSLEGIEFFNYPKEVALLKKQIADTRTLHPDIKTMFHIAHSLYATNKPTQMYPDSRVMQANGKQAIYYEGQEGAYFSDERKKQGWRWWIVYPALDNSYGKALLHSVDVMVDEIGCRGVFMDGFMTAYGSEYDYAHWDGRTAEIDPATKTITRKVGSVLLLSQDALVAFSRKMRDKGGQVVANNSVITRTIGKETYIFFDQELQEGPWTHLAPTVVSLSNAYRFTNEKEFYYDSLNKLKWGNLVFYYGDYPNNAKDFFTHPPLAAQMFPMTFEEIHAGWVKGSERIVTTQSDVYGWRGDRDLHFVHRYDAQGWEIPAGFLTTADAAGVRTQVVLGDKEAAVVRKVPLRLSADGPVNLILRRYDSKGIQLGLNGRGAATLTVAGGDFAVRPGATYVAKLDRDTVIKADAKGQLTIPVRLDGSYEICISSDRKP